MYKIMQIQQSYLVLIPWDTHFPSQAEWLPANPSGPA